MIEDAELLRRYAADRSEAAFAELVRRHINLVYSVAVRQLGGDAHLAHDATQKVFSALALKADSLRQHAVLAGWLYRSVHFEASKLVRSERRRRARELEASITEEIMGNTSDSTDWEKLRPLLDDALAELSEHDRDALMLRYLEGRPFADVGARLELTENAARMRVERALDKLHALLTRRGVTSTTAALALAMGGQAAIAAPAGLALSVTGVAVSGASAAGVGFTTAALHFMGMTKFTAVTAGALALAGAGGIILQQARSGEIEANQATQQRLLQEVAALRSDNQRLERTAAEVQALRADDAELAKLKVDAAKVTQLESARKKVASAAATERGPSSTVYDLASLDVKPKPTFQAAPTYPKAFRDAGTTGQAVIGFIVQADGKVSDLQVMSATLPEFGDAALEAVQRWRFSAGQKAGQSVGTRMQVPIVFSVSTQNKGAAPAPVSWF